MGKRWALFCIYPFFRERECKVLSTPNEIQFVSATDKERKMFYRQQNDKECLAIPIAKKNPGLLFWKLPKKLLKVFKARGCVCGCLRT